MVSFHAPAPGLVRGRRAVDGDVVHRRVPRRIAILQISQNGFQSHDGHGLQIASVTQRRIQQAMCQRLLLGRHFFERQTTASALGVHHRTGDEMPGNPLFPFEGDQHAGPLIILQRFQEPVGGLRHFGGNVVGRGGSCGQQGGGQGNARDDELIQWTQVTDRHGCLICGQDEGVFSHIRCSRPSIRGASNGLQKECTIFSLGAWRATAKRESWGSLPQDPPNGIFCGGQQDWRTAEIAGLSTAEERRKASPRLSAHVVGEALPAILGEQGKQYLLHPSSCNVDVSCGRRPVTQLHVPFNQDEETPHVSSEFSE